MQTTDPLAIGTSASGRLRENARGRRRLYGIEDDGVAGSASTLAVGVTDGSVACRVRSARTNGPTCALRPG
jgi:hypothetical protein